MRGSPPVSLAITLKKNMFVLPRLLLSFATLTAVTFVSLSLTALTFTSATVVSKCSTGLCQTNDDPACVSGSEPECVCVTSARGTPCVECGGRGYISDGICTCNLADMNPAFECTVALATDQTIYATRVSANATCNYYFDDDVGWYKRAQYTGKYGGPQFCSLPECYNTAIGPNPNGVPDETPQKSSLVACLRFGGPDPNSTKTDWVECSGHGAWNSQTQRCDCDPYWDLRNTFEPNPQNSTGRQTGTGTIATCSTCQPFYGPPPGTPDAVPCSVVYTPDPIDGVEKACGGHGTWTGFSCSCFNSTSTGFWNATEVTEDFTTLQYLNPIKGFVDFFTSTFTVLSCTSCWNGYSRENGCITN